MLNYLFKYVKMDASGRYGENWGIKDTIWSLVRLFVRCLRGRVVSLFFRERRGLSFIGRHTRIINRSYISAGRNFVAEDGCEVNGKSLQGLKFGNNVTIGKFALIRATNEYGGEPGVGLVIGDDSNIGPYSYIGCSGFIEIGKNVMISPRVSIYAENHNFSSTQQPMKKQGVTRHFVRIEDDCWIAANSIILAGVTIGQGSIVAAGSVVTNDVLPFSIVAGNPARLIKQRK